MRLHEPTLFCIDIYIRKMVLVMLQVEERRMLLCAHFRFENTHGPFRHRILNKIVTMSGLGSKFGPPDIKQRRRWPIPISGFIDIFWKDC